MIDREPRDLFAVAWLPIFCLFTLMAAPAAKAGIALVSQDRFVDVVTDDGRHQDQAAPDFGSFEANLTLSGLGAFQQSTLTVTPDGKGAEFTALLGNSAALGLSESSFLVNFDVAGNSVPYSVTYSSLTSSEAGPKPGSPGSFTGPSAPGALVNGDSLRGTLDVGQYTLQTTADFNGQISLDLKMGTAAVPLPSAFWAAAALLPAMLLGMRLRRIVAVTSVS